MAMYGTTNEQLAQIAVSTREWAANNPVARYRDPIRWQTCSRRRWPPSHYIASTAVFTPTVLARW
jgi:acetyl-CoA acetyltransferase